MDNIEWTGNSELKRCFLVATLALDLKKVANPWCDKYNLSKYNFLEVKFTAVLI